MTFGTQALKRGDTGADVIELQLRLAGFRGSRWDGDYGPGTELQVSAFQQDFMGVAATGNADMATLSALRDFAKAYPVDFGKLKCTCGQCSGFGQGQLQGQYRAGKPQVEAYYQYEYPGIHVAILHTFRAAQFYTEQAGIGQAFFTSGYRCWVNNKQKGRKSTNHMGKALDCDLPMQEGDDKEDDRNRCDYVRTLLTEKCGFQIGWGASNTKALEPSNISPTWLHMDVRCYQKPFLAAQYFVTSEVDLDAALAGVGDSKAVPVAAQKVETKALPNKSLVDINAILGSLNLP
jgi:hypothetical protein